MVVVVMAAVMVLVLVLIVMQNCRRCCVEGTELQLT
jgi:hypothetical protein